MTNTSVNPARSTGVALFQGSWAVDQLWMFWLVPILGGIVGGVVYRCLSAPEAGSRDLGAVHKSAARA